MSGNEADEGSLIPLSGSGQPATPFPRAIGRKSIKNVRTVREEMCRIYRAMATGKITVKDGNGMIFALATIVRTIEVEQIEAKLDAIEQEQRSTKG